MTGPGRRVHALATRWCSERARRRLIDPALADLQAEYAAAHRIGSRPRMVRALAAGYVALVKVLVIAGCGDLRGELRSWQPAERAGARGGVRVGLVIVVLATALLEVPFLTQQANTPVWLSIYLIPQALPLSVPLGLAVAVAWTLCGVARTRKLATAALVVAALASATMFANVAWVLPEANQTFRQRAFERLAPLADLRRGDNELTWPEARKRQADLRARSSAAAVRAFESNYYRKWAMSLAPLSIVGLIVALSFRRAWTRAGLTSLALALCASHFALLMSTRTLADLEILPPIVLGWSADAICMLAALLLACGSRYAATSPPATTR